MHKDKQHISRFDEMVIGALRDDVFSALEETELEERKEDSSKADFIAVSADKKHLDLLLRLRIPIKTFVWMMVIFIAILGAVLKLDPSILKYVQGLLAGA